MNPNYDRQATRVTPRQQVMDQIKNHLAQMDLKQLQATLDLIRSRSDLMDTTVTFTSPHTR